MKPETPRGSPKFPGDAPPPPPPPFTHLPAPRRGFLTKSLAILVGGIVALTPLVTGAVVFLDPLRKRKRRGRLGVDPDAKEGFVKVAMLDSLLVDIPQSFTVIDDRADAWNLFPREPVGAVYLLRRKDNSVLALNDECPHAGCGVVYRPGDKLYQCPCHRSSFKQDGTVANPKSPSPRGMDELEVDLKPNGEVWVKFLKFQSGKARKIPEE